MIDAIAKGVWLGFCIAAPVGPIGLLVMNRAIRSGRRAGLASGLGAALADLVYGILAVAGVRLAAGFVRPAALCGGVLLLWLAWRAWRQAPASTAVAAAAGSRTCLACWGTTFALTITNPMTLLAFVALVASTGANAPAWFVLGIFLGSMLWWTLLSCAAGWLGASGLARGPWLGRLAGFSLAAFGCRSIWDKGLG
jgi:threonine/homoserine/homoserine lactone efflux protein